MARTNKTKTADVSAPVSAVAAAPVAAPAPVEVKSKKSAKAPKVEAAPSTPAVVEVAPATPAVVETAPAPVDAEAEAIAEQSVEFLAKLQQLGVLISSLKTEFRNLEKKWGRELKTAQKTSKRKRKSGNRSPSGFVKPTRISDELAKFLDKPVGSEMARTEVTRDINTYIRSNNLQDKENGRKINPDTKLASLLKLKKTDELTYFNLQKYMSHHFAKAGSDVVAATA